MTVPFVSGVCEDKISDHERCRMMGCECRCHSGEKYSDQLGRAIFGERYQETPAISRGWPRLPRKVTTQEAEDWLMNSCGRCMSLPCNCHRADYADIERDAMERNRLAE